MKLLSSKLNTAVFKQTVILSFGTLLSQIIALSVTLILQRYFYTPAQFGEYNLFLNIASVFASIATLKYEYAVMIASDQYKAKHLFAIAILSSLVMSFIAVLVILSLQYFQIVNLGGTIIYLMVFLFVFFSGINEALNNWFNRAKQYVNMAAARVLQSLIGEGAKVLFYFTPLQSVAMQVGRVVGFGFSALVLFSFKFKEFKDIFKIIKFDQIKLNTIEEKKYPLVTTPNVLINSLNAAVFSYCIFEFYGAANLGFVSVAVQYVAVPLGIISSSFGQIYFQRISEINDRENLKANYLTNVKFLSLIAIFASITVFIIPESIYSFFLGNKWNGIAIYFKICIFYMSFSFVSSSVSFIYLKLDKHKILLYFSISQLILTYFSLFLTYKYGFGLVTSFLSFAFCQALYYFACIGLGWILLNKNDE
jgi:lipopolysaccharide exporter